MNGQLPGLTHNSIRKYVDSLRYALYGTIGDEYMNIIEEITTKAAVICHYDEPTAIAYINIYEVGDVWVKIQGCEACPIETRERCCGGCPMLLDGNCTWHKEHNSSKPFYCVIAPPPDRCHSWCSLEFKCIAGSMKGKIRRVRDKGNTFI